MNPLVSILIPAKNESAYLEDCLLSIQNQTYGNWECIVIDDHSEDDTFEIVRSFSQTDPRFKVFINKGKGIIEALQLAYEKSSGEYISRMDADDVMTENRVEVLLDNLLDNGKNFISVGKVHYFSENELGAGFKKYERWLNRLTEKGGNFKEIFKECVIPSPCWMIHRSDFDRCNAFNENRYPEDYDLAFRFYEAGYKVVPCELVLHNWRDYSTRTSRTDSNYFDDTFTELKTHYFFKSHRKADKELVVVGAGNRGKKLAMHLAERNEPFLWVDHNPKKIGKHIYDILIHSFVELQGFEDKQFIVTISNKEVKEKLYNLFKQSGLKEMEDFFFFA
jgi:glycosyltransferase involved in cell wall biosynthesis